MTSSRTLTTAFVAKLAFDFPELLAFLEAQIESSGAEVFPHSLMFNFEEHIAKMDPLPAWVEVFLNTLEQNFSTEEDDPVSNIIGVSFVEPLSSNPNSSSLVVQRLPPKLKHHFELCSGQK